MPRLSSLIIIDFKARHVIFSLNLKNLSGESKETLYRNFFKFSIIFPFFGFSISIIFEESRMYGASE